MGPMYGPHRGEGRRGTALQLGDSPVIHRRQPLPLRLQVLEHGKHFVVIEPVQRPRLQDVDHPRQLDERSTHSTGRGGGGPVERPIELMNES